MALAPCAPHACSLVARPPASPRSQPQSHPRPPHPPLPPHTHPNTCTRRPARVQRRLHSDSDDPALTHLDLVRGARRQRGLATPLPQRRAHSLHWRATIHQQLLQSPAGTGGGGGCVCGVCVSGVGGGGQGGRAGRARSDQESDDGAAFAVLRQRIRVREKESAARPHRSTNSSAAARLAGVTSSGCTAAAASTPTPKSSGAPEWMRACRVGGWAGGGIKPGKAGLHNTHDSRAAAGARECTNGVRA